MRQQNAHTPMQMSDASPGAERHDAPAPTDATAATVATVAVVGLGVAVFEAALLPGVILGVAAVWVPQYFPKMGAALEPVFRSTVRGAYKLTQKTRELVAEAQEQVEDIVAEVHAEEDSAASSAEAGGTPNR
jgi:hypothetical protein